MSSNKRRFPYGGDESNRDDEDDEEYNEDGDLTIDAEGSHLHRFRSVHTLGELEEGLVTLMKHQIALARERSAPFNKSTEGDSHARNIFKTMVPMDVQRRVFFKCIQTVTDASRAVCLFGTPPYPFLLPSDNGMLNAAGMSVRRVHMAYKDSSKIGMVTAAHFGRGMVQDSEGRTYRLHSSGSGTFRMNYANADSPIGLNSIQPGPVTFFVKTWPLTRKRMTAAARSNTSRWPRIGEPLVLTSTQFVQAVFGKKYELSCKVSGLQIPNKKAQVARIVMEAGAVSVRSIHKL